jgi:hypothetical protein
MTYRRKDRHVFTQGLLFSSSEQVANKCERYDSVRRIQMSRYTNIYCLVSLYFHFFLLSQLCFVSLPSFSFQPFFQVSFCLFVSPSLFLSSFLLPYVLYHYIPLPAIVCLLLRCIFNFFVLYVVRMCQEFIRSYSVPFLCRSYKNFETNSLSSKPLVYDAALTDSSSKEYKVFNVD